MAYSFKPYRELRISDDYMFGIIMRAAGKVCEAVSGGTVAEENRPDRVC